MILTCPECATRYQTDAANFAPNGRKVRCAKCGHVWHQAAPEPEPEDAPEEVAETPPAPPLPAAPERAAYAPPQSAVEDHAVARVARSHLMERLGLGAGWLALFAILVAFAWSGYRYRQEIAGLWPQSSTLYSALRIPVNTRGIDFRNKNAHFETENGQDVLVITGDLVNITSHELTVPAIRVSLTDDDKRELYHWSFSSGTATLAPGQSVSFHTRLPSPPPAARHIELRFADKGS